MSNKAINALINNSIEEAAEGQGQVLTTKIRELLYSKYNIEVENEFIEEFIEGQRAIIMMFANMMIMGTASKVSAGIVAFISSLIASWKLKDRFLSGLNWVKDLGNAASHMSSNSYYSTSIVKGDDNSSYYLKQISSTLSSHMVISSGFQSATYGNDIAGSSIVGSQLSSINDNTFTNAPKGNTDMLTLLEELKNMGAITY